MTRFVTHIRYPDLCHSILTHIEFRNPDWYHSVGQTLLRPASILFGRSYQIDVGGFHPSPNASLAKRVVIAALAILLFPVTLAAAGMGALLLARSVTHKRAYRQVVTGRSDSVLRESRMSNRILTLRSIKPSDLPFYQELFNNRVAMEKYAGGPRDIAPRFQKWLDRWHEHHFSALAVQYTQTGQVIGHVVVGHGDYEGNLSQGYSEMAGVGDPAFWNTDFRDDASGIGTAGKRHLGLEAARACMVYARALKDCDARVPCDVAPERRPEIEAAVRQNPALRVHRNGDGDIDGIYLPFTELRATARRDNVAAQKILQRVFVEENKGTKVPHPTDADRDLFAVNL